MEEYRIDIKVRNNLILAKIEEQGYSSPFSFCEATGISYGRLINFLNMKESIFEKKGKIKRSVMKLCEELNCIPEEIFSANQMESNLKDNKRTLKMKEAEVVFILQQYDNQELLEDNYHNNLLAKRVEEALNTLTPREQKIIEMRIGLGDYSNVHSLKEIGIELGLSNERIRQIEGKALRKLRDQYRSGLSSEIINN